MADQPDPQKLAGDLGSYAKSIMFDFCNFQKDRGDTRRQDEGDAVQNEQNLLDMLEPIRGNDDLIRQIGSDIIVTNGIPKVTFERKDNLVLAFKFDAQDSCGSKLDVEVESTKIDINYKQNDPKMHQEWTDEFPAENPQKK